MWSCKHGVDFNSCRFGGWPGIARKIAVGSADMIEAGTFAFFDLAAKPVDCRSCQFISVDGGLSRSGEAKDRRISVLMNRFRTRVTSPDGV